MSNPQSIIYICDDVRLNNRYEHTIYWDSKEAQEDYFRGKVVRTYSAYTYLRKSWSIKVQADMEDARGWSYLFFTNASNKYWYYFINNVEYVNDNTVELFLELDVMQTYALDYELLRCYVERQHVVDDAVGANVMDENLETGEFVINAEEHTSSMNDLCILVLSSIIPNGVSQETTLPSYAREIDNVFSGLSVWAIPANQWVRWGNQLENLSEWGKIDGIINMWMYPKAMVKISTEDDWDDNDVLCKFVTSVKSMSYSAGGYKTKLDGYTPKNNKLHTYPFSFLYASNNNGGDCVYRYERFYDPSAPEFEIYGALAPEAGCRLCPLDYNGSDDVNFHEALSMGAYPTCAWDSDTYKLWLANNQAQHTMAYDKSTLTIGAGAVAGIGSLLMGNIAGAVGGAAAAVSGFSQIGDLNAQKKDMSIQPPQARGSFSPNINIANDRQLFSLYHKSVDAAHAKMIDDYFTMYGYAQKRIMKPQRDARENWTFIKTVGCHIVANFAVEDAVKIESIFDRGVTFWKNGDQIGNYALSNGTV